MSRDPTVPQPRSLIRPLFRRLQAYVPGEQPRARGLVKLNTNENPCPPSLKVIEAIRKTAGIGLRFYPSPTAQPLREALARLHRCQPENLIIGNGSDELLALASRAFVEPRNPGTVSPRRHSRQTIQYFDPSYSLYPVLSDIHGARKNAVTLPADFSLPGVDVLKSEGRWDFQAALSYITTPNAPSGCGYSTAGLEALCRAQKGVVILDEAYADFAEENALALALRHPHVLVSRTFSKAYSLCLQRIGYFVGHPELIHALDKIRDSYNVNGLGQVAALTTLGNLDYYKKLFKKIKASRMRVTTELTLLGFDVLPSAANFLFALPPARDARWWFERLRERKILVRWFDAARVRDRIRITIGSDTEMKRFFQTVKSLKKLA